MKGCIVLVVPRRSRRAQRTRLLTTINRHGSVLDVPLRTLVDSMANGALSTAPLECAENFVEDRTRQLLALVHDAKGTPVETIVGERHRKIFTLCPTSQALTEWQGTLDATKAFGAEGAGRSPSLFFEFGLQHPGAARFRRALDPGDVPDAHAAGSARAAKGLRADYVIRSGSSL